MQNCIKGHSIGKVEKHCFKRNSQITARGKGGTWKLESHTVQLEDSGQEDDTSSRSQKDLSPTGTFFPPVLDQGDPT